MAIKRKCVCCGKEYEFCPNCMKKADPAWKSTFDSEECKELFNIVSAYNMKKVSMARVQAFLAEHNITDFNKFTGPIKKVLEETKPIIKVEPAVVMKEPPAPVVIREEPKPVVKGEPKVEIVPVVEEEPTVPETLPEIEDKTILEAPPVIEEMPIVEKAKEIMPTINTRPRRRKKRRSGY